MRAIKVINIETSININGKRVILIATCIATEIDATLS
jgi:hypothetical protein